MPPTRKGERPRASSDQSRPRSLVAQASNTRRRTRSPAPISEKLAWKAPAETPTTKSGRCGLSPFNASQNPPCQ